MANIAEAMEAKSDQLNALDIVGAPRVIRVRAVDYKKGRDQPVWVYFEGDNNRPWKPSKGMIRILCGCWGTETDAWIGRHAQLEFEPSVVYAGKPVGGIWLKAASDIPSSGMMFSLAINRQKRIPYPVFYLEVAQAAYPDDKFEAAFAVMAEKMALGEMTLQQVIARCQQTGQLTPAQIQRLEQAAPLEVQEYEENDNHNHAQEEQQQ